MNSGALIEYIILGLLVLGCALCVAMMALVIVTSRRSRQSYETPGKDQQEEHV